MWVPTSNIYILWRYSYVISVQKLLNSLCAYKKEKASFVLIYDGLNVSWIIVKQNLTRVHKKAEDQLTNSKKSQADKRKLIYFY